MSNINFDNPYLLLVIIPLLLVIVIPYAIALPVIIGMVLKQTNTSFANDKQ